ncbi:hypothetical protein Tco_0969021 [Tanacetum coccineum]
MADDYPLNNLKFVSKGGVDEVFEMPILKDMLTDAIQNSNCYKKYLEMASRKPRQPTTMIGEEVGRRKKASQAGKSKQSAPAKQPRHAQKKSSKPTPSNKSHKGKRFDHLVDEADEEPQPASEFQVEDVKCNLQSDVEGKGKGIVTDEQAAQSLLDLQNPKKQSIKDQYIFQRRSPVTQDASTGPSAQPHDDTSANVVHDTSSLADFTNDAETVADMEQSNSKNDNEILNVEEEHGEEVSNTVALEEKIAGPNPEPMHEDFIATVYPDVHENLNFTTEEQVHIENPPSSSGTLSSMKNLEDAFTFATTTTTTLPPPPPPPPQSIIDPDLATRVSALEKRSADFEQTNQLQDKTTQALASRVYKLENHDLYSKIDKQVNEVVKEAVHNALQAPLRERFRDLSEFPMKEILHDWMFESNSYRSHPDHTTLYEALEVSMQCENNDELHAALTKSRKRRHDD